MVVAINAIDFRLIDFNEALIIHCVAQIVAELNEKL
jgi:hypothetical protein